jgi:hypothetical protein
MPCLVFDQAAAGVTSCPAAQTKPASSRATAITALFLPIRPTRLRYLPRGYPPQLAAVKAATGSRSPPFTPATTESSTSRRLPLENSPL